MLFEKNGMRILKKIRESIAQKFKNQKNNQPTTTLKEAAIQEPGILKNAENDLLKRDEKQSLLEALNKEMTIEHLDGRKEIHTILTDAILRKNSRAVIEVLKLSEEYGILKEILGKKVRIKQTDGKEINQTPIDYANTNCREIAKIIKEFQDNLNIPANELVTGNTEAIPIKHEETNENSEYLDAHQPIHENSEQNPETNEQELDVPNSPSATKIELCSRSDKENSADEKSSKRTYQPIVAGIIGVTLLIGSIAFYALTIHIVISAVVGIVGLACIGFSLYSAMKPNTKLEKTESVELSQQTSCITNA